MTWNYPAEFFEDAWTHTFENAREVRGCPFCVCLGCRNSFSGDAVYFWTDFNDQGEPIKIRQPREKSTAHCPKCNQEAVLSNKDNDFPILNTEFVEQMSSYVTKQDYVENR
jgi:hypothetical protein